MSANYTIAINMIAEHDFFWRMSDSYTSSLNQAKAHKQLFVNALSTCTKEETQELKLKWMEAYKAATEAISNSFK